MLCGVLAPMWLRHGSGEALSLPKHFLGGSQPPLSVAQRVVSAGVGGGVILVAFIRMF